MESLGEGFGDQAVLPGPAVGVRNSHPLVSAGGGAGVVGDWFQAAC